MYAIDSVLKGPSRAEMTREGTGGSAPGDLELEIPASRPTSAIRASSRQHAPRQQSRDATQILPGRFRQCRIRAYQIPNHLPRRQIERAFRRRSHRQRYRALRTETNPLRRRLLPRLDTDRLREHINRRVLMSCAEFAAAT